MFKKIALILMLIAPMSVFAQKFGHIKSQEIVEFMPDYTKAQNDINTLQKQFEDEITRAKEEFNKKFAEFQQEQANLTQTIKERRQNELAQLQEKAFQIQQDAQMQLEKSWREMIEPIFKKIDDAIKAIGQEGGYVYIFDLNTTNIPYVSETLSTDITDAVKNKLGIK